MRSDPWITALLVMTFTGCAGASLSERYQDQDLETRTLFLTYYPDLNTQQRKTLLSHQQEPEKLIAEWGIRKSPLHGKPKNQVVGALKIRPRSELEITRGTRLDLTAILEFKDGREVDVTEDVSWHVLPSVARMQKNSLRFECASSDVTVTASFYGEREGSETYRIRKPFKNIEVGIAEISQGIDRSDYVRMKVLAHCQDGTVADVTCQSELSIAPEIGKTAGCGQLQILSPAVLRDGQIRVNAQYGEHSVTRWVVLPRRLPPQQ